jgi:hypothetical protein
MTEKNRPPEERKPVYVPKPNPSDRGQAINTGNSTKLERPGEQTVTDTHKTPPPKE